MKVSAVGIPWYTEQNYPRILEVMEDAHLLPSTYAEWRERAEAVHRDLERQRVIVYRVDIDPDSFAAWCRARGLNVDASGRSEFANQHAAFMARQKH